MILAKARAVSLGFARFRGPVLFALVTGLVVENRQPEKDEFPFCSTTG